MAYTVEIGDLLLYDVGLGLTPIMGIVIEIFYEYNHSYNDEGDTVRYKVFWFDEQCSTECSKEVSYFRQIFLEHYGSLLKGKNNAKSQ